MPWGAMGSLLQVPGLVPWGPCFGCQVCATGCHKVPDFAHCHLQQPQLCPASSSPTLTRAVNSSSGSVCNEPGPQGWGSVGEQPRQPPARRTANGSQCCGAPSCLPGALCSCCWDAPGAVLRLTSVWAWAQMEQSLCMQTAAVMGLGAEPGSGYPYTLTLRAGIDDGGKFYRHH